MTRRGDPEKIYEAQRSGIFRRLVDAERLDRLDAEHWIAQWEREAEATGREGGSTGFWAPQSRHGQQYVDLTENPNGYRPDNGTGIACPIGLAIEAKS